MQRHLCHMRCVEVELGDQSLGWKPTYTHLHSHQQCRKSANFLTQCWEPSFYPSLIFGQLDGPKERGIFYLPLFKHSLVICVTSRSRPFAFLSHFSSKVSFIWYFFSHFHKLLFMVRSWMRLVGRGNKLSERLFMA